MYTINQLAKSLNVPASTIRFYEKKELLSPKRGENNYRFFTEEDQNQLKLILVMKYIGFTLEQTREMLSLPNLPEKACMSQTEEMIQQKSMELTNKISNYTSALELLAILKPLAINNLSPEIEQYLSEQVELIFKNITKVGRT